MHREIKNSIFSLLEFISNKGLEGFDPYDALNSPLFRGLKSKWLRIAATVFFRLSPVNLRKLCLIKKGINPKAMGLLLSAYSSLYQAGILSSWENAESIYNWLFENYSKGYSGYCWGYNFPWQSRHRLMDSGIPTIVNTSFIGHGILDHYNITKKKEALDTARSACNYILKDLNIHETDHGICFSYSPIEKNIVHNANVLGASFLARVYSYTHEDELLDYAKKSFAFTLHHQHENGLWSYSISPVTGKERFQTDWHQGFILDSLIWFLKSAVPSDDKYRKALDAGAEFYKTQFTDKGACYWRYPRKWPFDIHNQAQGIITFSKLEEFFPGSIRKAERIAYWTLENLWDKKRGSFFYEKWPFITNKIPYFRWGQAWMLHALATLFAQAKSSPILE